MLSRRNFFKTAFALAAGALVKPGPVAAAPAAVVEVAAVAPILTDAVITAVNPPATLAFRDMNWKFYGDHQQTWTAVMSPETYTGLNRVAKLEFFTGDDSDDPDVEWDGDDEPEPLTDDTDWELE